MAGRNAQTWYTYSMLVRIRQFTQQRGADAAHAEGESEE